MFLDPTEFPFLASLESCYESIREEFLRLQPGRLLAWPERSLYKSGWDVFGRTAGL